jgi:Thioredoxin
MADLSWSSSGLEVFTAADFSQERLQRPGMYVVCFGAAWCPVTRRFMPKFAAEAGKLPGTLAIADITELNSPLWDTFRIKISPSILVFRDGGLVTRADGRRMLGITRAKLTELEHSLRAT